jgi:hypothetical protein
MKTAFYIEDGLEQIVLTPETEYEKKLLSLLHDQSRIVAIKRGSFYQTRGDWVRQGELACPSIYDRYSDQRKDDREHDACPNTTRRDSAERCGARHPLMPEISWTPRGEKQ